MPYEIYTCQRCDFQATSMVAWGLFSYQHGRRLIPLDRALGWCDDCQQLQAVEVLPGRFQAQLVALNARIKKLRRRQHWLARMLRLEVGFPPEYEQVARERRYVRAQVKNEKSRAAALASRRSGPRCLTCGSEACTPLPIRSVRGGDGAAEAGFTHPGCGGAIVFETAPVRINAKLFHRIYDTEGRLLRIEEDARRG